MFSDVQMPSWCFLDVLEMFDDCRIFFRMCSGCSDGSCGPGAISWSFQMKVWALMIQWNSMIPKSLMIPWTEIIQKYTVVPLSLMVLFNLFFTFANACSMSLSNLSLNYCSMWLSWIFFNNRAVSVTSDRVLFNRLTKVEMTKKGYTIIGGGGVL